ncbi:putative ATP-grasp superfamily ATP-dependent carboligase [Phyllobacterium ifriqiyense]|uniref:ATP-grasp superfamily ATP-dependent carboligase n=2 Tax=Phyllobacterium ifriqiyense TaxID=314238 RepID=A0ABU0S6K4_9HYPH|nr:putative ATP-grasp superfamily ATP-dependent carboligase [Phyllobacterium ifriqiyense]
MISGMRSPLLAILPNSAVLIAAVSGRALAAAARRAGLRPLVADLFNDSDTLALAERAIKLSGSLQDGIGEVALLEALKELAGDEMPVALIYGSGFEANPGVIDAISRRFAVAGNSAQTIRAVKDPVNLQRLCRQIGIPHPAIAFEAPNDLKNWLVKRSGAAGGSHVRQARDSSVGRQHYYQRFISGRNLSALFLADRKRANMIGFSRQWVSPTSQTPFRYGGAVRLGRYDRKKAALIETWLNALVEITGLVGLCSADFIDDRDLHLIEINPRPGATLDIFDCEETPLLLEHMRATIGSDIQIPSYAGSSASGIAYADKALGSFPDVNWPVFTADHQISGTALQAGDPICTVFATAPSASAAMKAVKDRIKQIAVNWREEYR